MRHFLKETDFSTAEAADIFATAARFKNDRKHTPRLLAGESWGMLFYKSSTRTRVSFQVGISELGGNPVVLDTQTTQMGRGESVADTAQVLSRFMHGLIIRTFGHEIVGEFAANSAIPIVNGLTDFLHPCQTYSDLFSLAERWGGSDASPDALKGRKLAFLGDTASNMANSLLLGAAMFGMEVALAGPRGFEPGKEILDLLEAEGLATGPVFTTDPNTAARNADIVYTDVWVSMGDEDEADTRKRVLAPYQVSEAVMSKAKPDALFMHCLPAHPGQEVTREVLDSPRSIIFDQAENRLHVQKAILAKLVEVNRGS